MTEMEREKESSVLDMPDQRLHLFYMQNALDEARKCAHVPTAFCVGCVIVLHPEEIKQLNVERNTSGATPFSLPLSMRDKGFVLATGYSRELPGNTHAEANALNKARQFISLPSTLTAPSSLSDDAEATTLPWSMEDLLAKSSMYTTLEPCSVRTSGLAPCANAILDAKIKRCYIGAPEPPDFVTCEGAKILRDAGVEVVWVKGFEEECLRVARGEF